jgi:hypothetical protein
MLIVVLMGERRLFGSGVSIHQPRYEAAGTACGSREDAFDGLLGGIKLNIILQQASRCKMQGRTAERRTNTCAQQKQNKVQKQQQCATVACGWRCHLVQRMYAGELKAGNSGADAGRLTGVCTGNDDV